MTKLLSPILADYGPDMVAFWCPGCRCNHPLRVGPAGHGAAWGYNSDPERPTFTPSVLVRSGHHIGGGQPGDCWCDFTARTGQHADFECIVCHSFVADGRIQFLTDSTHALAGQTVDLPPFGSGEAR